MTGFFFIVGLEIKRELVNGQVRDPKTAALPVLGEVGGPQSSQRRATHPLVDRTSRHRCARSPSTSGRTGTESNARPVLPPNRRSPEAHMTTALSELATPTRDLGALLASSVAATSTHDRRAPARSGLSAGFRY